MPRTLERRFTSGEVELRTKNGKQYIEGYAAVFDKTSQNLGGFVEVVRSSAFNKTLGEADVRAVQNHDPNFVLGRSSAGTLELSTDDTGLYYRIDPPDTTFARDLIVSLERKDITQSSFAFHAIDDDWSLDARDFPLRELLDVALVDVSPVTYPAYLDTTSGATRSAAMASLAKRCGSPVDLSDTEAVRAAIRGDEPPALAVPPADATPEQCIRAALAYIKARYGSETALIEALERSTDSGPDDSTRDGSAGEKSRIDKAAELARLDALIASGK